MTTFALSIAQLPPHPHPKYHLLYILLQTKIAHFLEIFLDMKQVPEPNYYHYGKDYNVSLLAEHFAKLFLSRVLLQRSTW